MSMIPAIETVEHVALLIHDGCTIEGGEFEDFAHHFGQVTHALRQFILEHGDPTP